MPQNIRMFPWAALPLLGLLAVAEATLTPLWAAEAYQCKKGHVLATVEVQHDRSTGELPCRVVLIRQPGEMETLWRARYERGFCAKKAKDTRTILEGRGWRCQGSIGEYGRARADRCSSRDAVRPQLCSALDAGLADERTAIGLEQRLRVLRPDEAIAISLSESVSLALRNSRDVESGYLGRIRDRLALEFAEDEFWPDLTIEAGQDYSSDEGALADVSSTASLRLPTGGELSVTWANEVEDESGATRFSGDIVQPIWGGAGIDANLAELRQARLADQAGDLAFRNQVIDLVSDVAISHRSLTIAEAFHQVAARSLERAIEQKRINHKLFEAGRIARFEAVQSDASIASREVDLASAQLDLQDARRQLLDLLDIDTNAAFFAEDSLSPSDISIDLDDALDLAYRYRPDLRISELAIQASRFDLDKAKSSSRADVDLVAGIDYGKPFYEDRDIALSNAGTNYRAGVRFKIPFGDVARDQAVALARLGIRESDVALNEVRGSIASEIANLVSNLETSSKRVGLARRAEELAEQQLEAEQAKQARGLSSTLDVILLEDALIDAQLTTLDSQVAYANILTKLDRAMGTTLLTWGIRLER